MKEKIIVINLTYPRAFLLGGIFFLLLGLFYYLGKSTTIEKEECLYEEISSGWEIPQEEEIFSQEIPSVEEEKAFSSFPVDKKSYKELPKKKATLSSFAYYIIQVGAYKREVDALRIKRKLEKWRIPARVDRGILYYYVRVGKEDKKEDLLPLKKKIENLLKIRPLIKEVKSYS